MAKICEGRHKLKLGKSFDKKANETYQTIRYDFKPASVEECKESYAEIGAKSDVTVSIPKLDSSGEVKDVTLFRGSRKPVQKECLLIYDHDTGEFTLEEVSSNIQIKQVRACEEEKEKNLQYVRDIRKKFRKETNTSPHQSAAPPVPVQSMGDLVMSDDESDSSSSGDDDENESDGGKSSHLSAGSEDDIVKSLEAAVDSSYAAGKSSNFEKSTVAAAPVIPADTLHRDLLLSDSSDDDD